MRLGAIVLAIWLIIGAVAAGQRGYYSKLPSCASAGTVIVTILAGPNHRKAFFGHATTALCGFQARAGRVSGPWMTVTPGNGAHRKQHYADLAGLAQAAGAFPAYAIPGARKPESAYFFAALTHRPSVRAAKTSSARFRRGTRVVGWPLAGRRKGERFRHTSGKPFVSCPATCRPPSTWRTRRDTATRRSPRSPGCRWAP